MKANKLFFAALFLAAVSMVGCKGKNEAEAPAAEDVTISLDKSSLVLKKGESALLTATVTPAGTAVEWTSLHPAIATVDKGLVTAVAEGNTTIIATAGDKRAICSIQVGQGEEGKTSYQLIEASAYYPVFVDETTLEKMGSKVAIDFGVDDQTKHFWNWVIEGTTTCTYEDVTPTGRNFYDNADGEYMALVVGNGGWAGGGYDAPVADVQALVDAINAEPDKFFFHIGMRSTDGYGHLFYFFGQEKGCHFCVGSSTVYGGTNLIGDFKRDGYWYEFNVPMSQFAEAMSGLEIKAEEGSTTAYFLSFLSQGIAGAQLNYDAVYFYKK